MMKNFLAVAMSLAVFVLLGFSMWYVAYRLNILFGASSNWPIQIVVILGIIGAIVFMLAGTRSANTAIGMLNVVGGYVFTFFIFLLLTLLVLHAIQLVVNIPMAWGGTTALLLAILVTGLSAWRAHSYIVNETKISLPGLEKEIVVMHISDVHLGHHRGRAYLQRIVEETNRKSPDLVLITGDLIDSYSALNSKTLSPLSQFEAPVYYVGGNHEKYVDPRRASELIAEQGVNILHNEVIETHGLQIIGLDYMNADEETFDMHPSDDHRTIKSVLLGIALNNDSPSLLMHHSPVGSNYVSQKGIDLMISGHTHAGQIFPFTLLADLIFPFNRGLHKVGDTAVFISNGAGTFMFKARLGTSNEINLLRLRTSQ